MKKLNTLLVNIKVIPIIILFCLLFFESKSQMLVNSKRDSLQEISSFYYNHIVKQKRLDLFEGFYYIIFDISVNIDSVSLSLIRNNKAPILYQKSNGYFFFVVHENSNITFDYKYLNHQDNLKLFAKLYRIPENVIGKELNSEFTITDIYGNNFDKESFKGYTSIFFSSYRYDLYPIINEVKRKYRTDSLILVSFNKDLPKDLYDYQKKYEYFDIIFVSDYLFNLNPWTNYMPKSYPGAIIFISDDETRLQYRNFLDINHNVNEHELKSDIYEVLKRIK